MQRQCLLCHKGRAQAGKRVSRPRLAREYRAPGWQESTAPQAGKRVPCPRLAREYRALPAGAKLRVLLFGLQCHEANFGQPDQRVCVFENLILFQGRVIYVQRGECLGTTLTLGIQLACAEPLLLLHIEHC